MKKRIPLLCGLALCTALLWGMMAQAVTKQTSIKSQQEATIMTGEGIDATYQKKEGTEVIYLAGGCFWGMEKLTQALPGVVDATNGYANCNADAPKPNYKLVCSGGTGFKETVRVIYDPKVISLPQILQAYFLVIDPTVANQQGNDKGAQYQTGIYYNDAQSELVVEEAVATEAKKYKVFTTEHEPLRNFYDAEEYHQDYLDKNPGGYCHIPAHEIDEVVALIRAEQNYKKPSQEHLKETLTLEQYAVTQHAATEPAFTGEYWETADEGIYVDITTGEPLFCSTEKYESGCGWPSFTAPIYEGAVRYGRDTSHNMQRTEVRSGIGDAHLGHIFENDSRSPTGTRYCINSAALRFVPKSEVEAQGYSAYLILFR